MKDLLDEITIPAHDWDAEWEAEQRRRAGETLGKLRARKSDLGKWAWPAEPRRRRPTARPRKHIPVD